MKKSYVLEGGAYGRMLRTFDNCSLSLNDIVNIYDVATSTPNIISEKVDGFNLMFSINEDGDAVFARNQTQVKNAMIGKSIVTSENIEDLFSSRGSGNKEFISSIKIAAKQIAEVVSKNRKDKTISGIELENELSWGIQYGICWLWFNIEVINTENESIIKYENNMIVYHQPVFMVLSNAETTLKKGLKMYSIKEIKKNLSSTLDPSEVLDSMKDISTNMNGTFSGEVDFEFVNIKLGLQETLVQSNTPRETVPELLRSKLRNSLKTFLNVNDLYGYKITLNSTIPEIAAYAIMLDMEVEEDSWNDIYDPFVEFLKQGIENNLDIPAFSSALRRSKYKDEFEVLLSEYDINRGNEITKNIPVIADIIESIKQTEVVIINAFQGVSSKISPTFIKQFPELFKDYKEEGKNNVQSKEGLVLEIEGVVYKITGKYGDYIRRKNIYPKNN